MKALIVFAILMKCSKLKKLNKYRENKGYKKQGIVVNLNKTFFFLLL